MELKNNVFFDKSEDCLEVKLKIYNFDNDPDHQIYVLWECPHGKERRTEEAKYICKDLDDLIATLEKLETQFDELWDNYPRKKHDYIENIVQEARILAIDGHFDIWIDQKGEVAP